MCPRLTGRVLVCIHYLGVIIKHTCLDNKLLWCVYMYIFMYMCAIVCSCMYVWVCVPVYTYACICIYEHPCAGELIFFHFYRSHL